MEAGLSTPLLDFFRRGEVAQDVRLLAARGVIAPRAIEQLGILAWLSDDPDPEVRATAEATLDRLPAAAVAGFIARSDMPLELREFFVRRGVQAAVTPSPEADEPLVDADPEPEPGDAPANTEDAASVAQRLSSMTVPQKIKAAMKGTREMRAHLIRDPNRIVAFAVLSCPRVTEQEVETFAKMTNVNTDILRTIGQTRGWMKNYAILVGLTRNPKTPVALSLTLMHRLIDRDLRMVSMDRNVPEPLRLAARRKVVAEQR